MDGTKLNKRQLKRTLISIRDEKLERERKLKNNSPTDIIENVIVELRKLSSKLSENDVAKVNTQISSLNNAIKILDE